MTRELVLLNALPEIQRLMEEFKDFGQEAQIPAAVIHDVNLVFEEVVSNTILYGYHDQLPHHIAITMSYGDRLLTLKIEDDGLPFNPLDRPDPDLNLPIEEREIGGLGIYLTKKLVDTAEYCRVKDKNRLLLQKTIIM